MTLGDRPEHPHGGSEDISPGSPKAFLIPLVPARLPVPNKPIGPHSSSSPPGLPRHMSLSLSPTHPRQHWPVPKKYCCHFGGGGVCTWKASGGQRTALVRFLLIFETEPLSGPELDM